MTRAHFTYRAGDEAATERLGQALAEVLPIGCVVALDGPLGAGKTRLVQAIAASCGVDRRDVVSPTFVLMHEYQGTRPIVHLDAYRLRDADEFLQLGAPETFGGANLVLIEWAERVANCLPNERLAIAISVLPDDARQFKIEALGVPYVPLIKQLRDRLSRA
ncbi:MAG: tRNA (adenosine(37)-N6)-threonylcarbamoyltransferase complex ATPase subunit type 1 TsaE [Planctomycetia bacterium]|nr:tRNA (adenosine(37)-N6)-threonylcarbamoyltransferase complex ATPase subunit type 1 TsaE [Planctomycetia bacterium]